MKKVIVLGAGLVGKSIAIDLAKNHQVTSVDIDQMALNNLEKEHGIHTVRADLMNNSTIKSLVDEFDLVIGAVPGFMGFKIVQQGIRAGKNIVDISFFPEDPFELDQLAKKKGVTAVIDCGVAPGLSNFVLGYQYTKMDIHSFKCLVGGLPVIREWPWQYKAVFSPADVIEEYTRPARFIQNGKLVIREALSDTELIETDSIGTLEAWNSDGLRTLAQTMKIPNMIEKTLRYPGSVEYLKVLRASGFFSKKPINVKGREIRPLDLTSKLLFSQWKLEQGQEDITVMQIIIEGNHEGNSKKITYNLLDRFDKSSNTTSMARTTGYTCTAVANLVLNNQYSETGISPPEFIGENESHYQFVLNYLAERNIIFTVEEQSGVS